MCRYYVVTKLGVTGCCLLTVLITLCAAGQETPAPITIVDGQPAATHLVDNQPFAAGLLDTAEPCLPACDAAKREAYLQFTPYGALWANMLFATSRTNPGPFTL